MKDRKQKVEPRRRYPESFRIRVTIHMRIAQARLDELLSYSDEIERILDVEAGRVKERVRARALFCEPDRVQDFLEDGVEDIAKIEETFPRIFRNSLFVQCAAEFEHRLISIAKVVQTSKNIELSLGELRDEGIRKAKTFLKKVAGLPFPDEDQEWQEALALSSVRNVIVHQGGRIAQDQKVPEVRQLVKTWKSEIEIEPDGQLILGGDFVKRALGVYIRFFHALRKCIK